MEARESNPWCLERRLHLYRSSRFGSRVIFTLLSNGFGCPRERGRCGHPWIVVLIQAVMLQSWCVPVAMRDHEHKSTYGLRAGSSSEFAERWPAQGVFVWRHMKPGINGSRHSGETPDGEELNCRTAQFTSVESACR